MQNVNYDISVDIQNRVIGETKNIEGYYNLLERVREEDKKTIELIISSTKKCKQMLEELSNKYDGNIQPNNN